MTEYDPVIHGHYQQYQERQARELVYQVTKRAKQGPGYARPVDAHTVSLAVDESMVRSSASAATFIVTTKAVDRDQDIVEPLGIRTDNWEKAGAPWFVSHGSEKLPIGSSLHPETGELHFKADGNGAVATCFFDMADPVAREVKRKVCELGIMRASSIAFVPIEYEKMSGPGHLFRDVDLTEISIVPVPSNPQALLQACSPTLKHCLTSYCKDNSTSTQADMEGNMRVPEDVEAADPNTDEVNARYGPDADAQGEDLLDRYQPANLGQDPNGSIDVEKGQPSPQLLAALFSHGLAEVEYLSKESKGGLDAYTADYVAGRTKHILEKFMELYPTDSMQQRLKEFDEGYEVAMRKAFTQNADTEGVDGPASSGEELLINQGNIPDEDDQMTNKEIMASAYPDSADMDDADTSPPIPEDGWEQSGKCGCKGTCGCQKSWDDSPADPVVVERFARFENFCRMHGLLNGDSPRTSYGTGMMGMLHHEAQKHYNTRLR
jgi:hypothetical protein